MIRLLALMLCLLCVSPSQPARAESDGGSVMNWRSSLPRVQPRQPRQTYQARRRYSPVRVSVPRAVLQDDSELGLHMPELRIEMPLPADALRTKIAVIGDSLAEALAFGFDADLPFKTEFLVRQKTVSASGLVRDDFHSWPVALAAMLQENPDLKALVIMVGLNDRQTLRAGEQTLEPLTPAWREAYLARIDALLAVRPAALPVIWVGLPPVRLPKLAADLAEINGLVRDRVQMAGQVYVDTVDAFADANGAFTPTGPDVIGDVVRLRGPDGIHFTPAGQRKLAFFAERALRRALAERQDLSPARRPAPAHDPASPAPAGEPAIVAIPSSPGFGAYPDPQLDMTLPIALPGPRPAIGEARNIVELRVARELISAPTSSAGSQASRQVFDRGLPVTPRTGRSDDYRWR